MSEIQGVGTVPTFSEKDILLLIFAFFLVSRMHLLEGEDRKRWKKTITVYHNLNYKLVVHTISNELEAIYWPKPL